MEFFRIDTDDECEEETMVINTVREGEEFESAPMVDEDESTKVPIIVDSGADASLFPGHLMGKGAKAAGASPYLQDAHGSQIKTYGRRGHRPYEWTESDSEGKGHLL